MTNLEIKMIFSTLKNKAKDFLGQYEQKDPATFAAAQQAIGGLLILDGFVGIDNPFEGKKRSGIFGTLGGIVFGILFMLVPTFFGNILGTNSMTATTNAVVVTMTPQTSSSSNSASACAATVRYSVAGKEYTQPSSFSSSSYCALAAGQTVSVNYNPQNPGAWAYGTGSTKGFLSLFFWIGLLTAIMSFVTFVIRLLSIIFGWKLLQSGRALAKTLPQGVSLGTLIEEIKQNFKGTLFKGGGVNMPRMPFMQSAQSQGQVPAVIPVATMSSPVEAPVQQTPVTPVIPAPVTPQFVVPNNDLSVQPVQEVAPVIAPTPSEPYVSDMVEVEPPTVRVVQPQPVVQNQNSYPSSTPPTQPPLS
jgi:hypothetical protein